MDSDNLPILSEATAGNDPLSLFTQWYADAESASIVQPEAMTLATVSLDRRPSARVVLLREFDDHGFVFYTNYESRKASELEANPHVAMVWHWKALLRQIRVEGTVARVLAAESDAYFHSRPRGSQLGALASRQSQVVSGRTELDENFADAVKTHQNEVPRPEFWGGYRVWPVVVEFWQSRDNRMHDRLRFQRTDTGEWRRDRLAP